MSNPIWTEGGLFPNMSSFGDIYNCTHEYDEKTCRCKKCGIYMKSGDDKNE